MFTWGLPVPGLPRVSPGTERGAGRSHESPGCYLPLLLLGSAKPRLPWESLPGVSVPRGIRDSCVHQFKLGRGKQAVRRI